jgi:hypothetical protein
MGTFPQQSSASIDVDGSPANFEGRFEMLEAAIKTTIANIKAAAETR